MPKNKSRTRKLIRKGLLPPFHKLCSTMRPQSDSPDPPKRVGRIKQFVPYATMYKIDCSPVCEFVKGPRQLICINCDASIDWKVYNIAAEVFDAKCPSCKVPAVTYWKGKVHKELPDG